MAEHRPNFLQPLPDLVDREEEYKVETVLDHHRRLGCCTFLTQQKGYSTVEDTWEPKCNLGNASPPVITYKISHLKDFPEYHHHHPSCQK